MSTRPQAGEVWYADLGLAAKGRPVLVLFAPGEEDARSLVVVAPLTSQIRHLRGEVSLDEAAAAAKTATRNYAKRQLTWIRSNFNAWNSISAQVLERTKGDIFRFAQ